MFAPARASSARWPRISPMAASLRSGLVDRRSCSASHSDAPATPCWVPNSRRSGGPGHSLGDRNGGIDTQAQQPRGLANQARLVLVGERAPDAGERPLAPGAWILGRQVDQHPAGLDASREPSQPVAAHQCLAADEIVLPVVPVAGEHAAVGQDAFAQGVAFVRAAVGAGEHAAVRTDQQHLGAPLAHDSLALSRQFVCADDVGPGHGSRSAPTRRCDRRSVGPRSRCDRCG